jgi:hypothetical protein
MLDLLVVLLLITHTGMLGFYLEILFLVFHDWYLLYMCFLLGFNSTCPFQPFNLNVLVGNKSMHIKGCKLFKNLNLESLMC